MAQRGSRKKSSGGRPSNAARLGRTGHSGSSSSRRYPKRDVRASSAYQKMGAQPSTSANGAASARTSSKQAQVLDRYSRNSATYSQIAKKSHRNKKIITGVLTAFLVAVVGVGGALALYMDNLNSQLMGHLTEEEMQDIQDALIPLKNFNEPFYMMLIGSDARADDAGEGERADTAILARIDAPKGQVTLISIPRDTMIEIDGYGTNKFNAAYAYGGTAGTIKEANKLCDVQIANFAEIDFDKLIELVDVVGGIEVDVPELIDDPDAGDIVIQPGKQIINGEQALVFARSRAYVDGDFTRTSNQRLIIEGLANKILSLPATELPTVVQQAAGCVATNLQAADLLSLATQLQGAGELTMYSAMVPSSVTMVDEISYVVADKTMLKQMMEIVEEGGDPNEVQGAPGLPMAM